MGNFDQSQALTDGPVLIIGTGLIGGSLGFALRKLNIEVYLQDASPTSLALAQALGAGKQWHDGVEQPSLIIVATPPDVCAGVVCDALLKFDTAVVTEVASVKEPITQEVISKLPDLAQRYCPVHPMTGREVNGVGAASADLFPGRPWVVVPTECTGSLAKIVVRNLGVDLGGHISEMTPAHHDQAVALVSHVPQLVSSLLAGQLLDAPLSALSLAGGGLRDTTRIAASDPRLWNAILTQNAPAVGQVLEKFHSDVGVLLKALREAKEVSQLVGVLNSVLESGNEGRARIPGKHGSGQEIYGTLTVIIPDTPGSLGRLFNDTGQAGINVEDLHMEHSLGQAQGLVSLSVVPSALEPLKERLTSLGWQIVTQG